MCTIWNVTSGCLSRTDDLPIGNLKAEYRIHGSDVRLQTGNNLIGVPRLQIQNNVPNQLNIKVRSKRGDGVNITGVRGAGLAESKTGLKISVTEDRACVVYLNSFSVSFICPLCCPSQQQRLAWRSITARGKSENLEATDPVSYTERVPISSMCAALLSN